MAVIDIQVPDIGDFDEVGVIEVLVKVPQGRRCAHLPHFATGPQRPGVRHDLCRQGRAGQSGGRRERIGHAAHSAQSGGDGVPAIELKHWEPRAEHAQANLLP